MGRSIRPRPGRTGTSGSISGIGEIFNGLSNVMEVVSKAEKSGHGKKGVEVDEMREPFVDIFEEALSIEVIAELPGVEEEDISHEIKENLLIIKASGSNRKYSKEVLLPCSATILKTAYKNGVFKLTLKKNDK